MKKHNKNKIKMRRLGVVLMLVFTLMSCNLWIKPPEELNPPDLDEFLSRSQITLAKALGGFDVSITTAMWIQQVEGISGKALTRYNYIYSNSEVNNLWADLYTGSMNFLDSIIRIGEEKQAYYYVAVAKIMLAMAYGNVTDLFGDIPCTQAFRVDTPAYDPQETVYNRIFQLLDEAITLIDNGDPGNEPLGDGDLIYGWDMQRWRKAAYTLKARYLMHLIKVKQIDYNQVLSYLDQGLSSLDDDMKLVFYLVNQYAPIYEYLNRSDGIANNKVFQTLLVQRKDPRISVLSYNGFWARQDAYFPFVQYTEALFLRSEAYWRLGNYQAAREVLKQAINASMDKYMVYDNQWYEDFCAQIDTLTDSTLLREIAIQKYLDLVYHPESFTDWRRLDLPYLDAVAGDSIPRRFPYAKSELDNNPLTPQWGDSLTIWTPVWWDTAP